MPDLGTRRKLGVALVAGLGLVAGFVVIVLVARHPGAADPGAAAESTPTAATTTTEPVTESSPATSAGPVGSPSSGSESEPRVHAVGGNLCSAVDFTLANPFGGSEAPPVGDHSDKAGYTAYTCDRHAGRIRLTVTALVFGQATAATARYADTTAHPPANVDAVTIPALGEAAVSYTSADGLSQVWVRDGNLVLGVRLAVPEGQPLVLEAAARHIAQTALSRL